jgi:6-phosphogluconolactonase
MGREIRVVADAAALSRAAAEELTRVIHEAVEARGRATIALAGGSTPRALYEQVAQEPMRSRIPWARVHLFWGDERCVPPDQPESNFHMTHETLLARVPIPASNIHRIPVEHGDPDATAQAYERALREHFRLANGAWPAFDLILLGLGADGHTASLFPGTPAARETARLAVATRGGEPNVARVTLTLPVLNHARRVAWLISGAAKAPIVRRVLEGGAAEADGLPAQSVQPLEGTAVWLLDRAAAGELPAAFLTGQRED